MIHKMPELPYEATALAPRMSEETLNYHYGKHLQTYVDNLNRLVTGTPYEEMSLEELVCKATGPVFNNAAQVWNHTFFFETLSPQPQPMSAKLEALVMASFGSLERFYDEFFAAATSLFGSGWVWLAMDHGNMVIVSEQNAGNPLLKGNCPLMVVDVWEHAYYVDYRNRRADYVKAVWELTDWSVVEKRLSGHASCNLYI